MLELVHARSTARSQCYRYALRDWLLFLSLIIRKRNRNESRCKGKRCLKIIPRMFRISSLNIFNTLYIYTYLGDPRFLDHFYQVVRHFFPIAFPGCTRASMLPLRNLNLIDLSDAVLTSFLPLHTLPQVALGRFNAMPAKRETECRGRASSRCRVPLTAE